MGSPLGPTIAKIFPAHMEHTVFSLNSNLDFQPKSTLYYVDYIFAFFHDDTPS